MPTTRDQSGTSIAGGLICSVGLHALLGLAFAMWGDRPVARSPGVDDSAMVVYLPPPEPPPEQRPEPPPEPKPETPEQPKPEPPPPPPPPLRLGIDDSTADTPAWLGFKEATEHNAPKADISQSAMELEPGQPGPPGPAAAPGPASPSTPLPPTPALPQPTSSAAPQAASAPPVAQPPPQAPAPPAGQPSASPAEQFTAPPPLEAQNPPPTELVPSVTPIAPFTPSTLVTPPVQVPPIAPVVTPVTPAEVTRPPAAEPDPELRADPTEVPEGRAELAGEPLTTGPDLQAGERIETTPGEVKPVEATVVPAAATSSTHQVEVGPLPEGVERPIDSVEVEPSPEPAPELPPEALQEIGPPLPESLLPIDPSAAETPPGPEQVSPAEASSPDTPAEQQPEPSEQLAPPVPAVQSGGGGNDGRPGERSDRESDASSMKPIRLDRITLGRVMAGEGVNVRTTRPRWSTTTLLTTAPKNPVIRVTFGRSGKVIEAGFVNDQSTGYDNVDEPLLNAVHSWTASGKQIRELPANDPRAGLTIVFIITLR